MSRRCAFVFASMLAIAGCTTSTQDNFTNPPPGPPASCTAVPALAGCTAGSVSYSCAGDRPDDGDTNLVCDQGTPGIGGDAGGTTLFCCAPYGQWATECTSASVTGCGSESIGFSCSGGTSPAEADTSLVCSAALQGTGGKEDYCCISFDQSSGLCASGDAGCSGAAIGFDCAPGHAPTDVNSILVCEAPDGGGAGSYCCETP